MGIPKKMQPCIWEMPECLFGSKASTGCFQICLHFQNNLAKDGNSLADKLCEPQMKLQGVFLPELSPQHRPSAFSYFTEKSCNNSWRIWGRAETTFPPRPAVRLGNPSRPVCHGLCGSPSSAWRALPWDLALQCLWPGNAGLRGCRGLTAQEFPPYAVTRILPRER